MAPYSLSGVIQISRSLEIPNSFKKNKKKTIFNVSSQNLQMLARELSELGARSPMEAVIWEIAISASHTHTHPRELRQI